MRLGEGGGRLAELQGGKLKAPRVGKVVTFEVGAVGAEEGNLKEVEELLSRLWVELGRGRASGGERRE